ncbi:hypothetical protein Dimus_006991 [Dionaea muscipula]
MAHGGNSDSTFPPVDVDGVLNPGSDKSFHVDPVSSQVDKMNPKENKAEAAAEKKKKCCANKDPMQTLKTSIIVSGVIFAVIGAVFAISKKMREK